MCAPSCPASALTGVILAAGEGSRIRPISDGFPKAALPVGNRAMILHHLDALRGAGIREAVIVVGAASKVLREIVGADDAVRTMRIRYIEQPERRGIAHAVSCAATAIDGDFVLLLADIFMPDHRLGAAIDTFRHGACAGVLGAKHEPDPELMRRNFSIDVHGGLVRRVIEKPNPAHAGLKGVGTYVFTRAIFDAIARTPVSPLRGEQEITDAVQVLIDSGAPVRAEVVTENDINVNDAPSLLRANMALLGAAGNRSLIAESATVVPGASIDRSVIGSRAMIAPGVALTECVVLDGVPVTAPGSYTRCIFAPGHTVRIESACGSTGP